MSIEQYTCWRMRCDKCRKNLWNEDLPGYEGLDFSFKECMLDFASQQGWVFDHDTASWYCPGCQEEHL